MLGCHHGFGCRLSESKTNGLARFGEAFRVLMSLPLSELRELRPEGRDHLIDGFREAGLA